jgi:hypothetical protein
MGRIDSHHGEAALLDPSLRPPSDAKGSCHAAVDTWAKDAATRILAASAVLAFRRRRGNAVDWIARSDEEDEVDDDMDRDSVAFDCRHPRNSPIRCRRFD